MVSASGLCFSLPDKRETLTGVHFELKGGEFLAVLGENGAGKTTLLDILMGFRRRSAGNLTVLGGDPEADPWNSRYRIAYLSEKLDLPGDWDATTFLSFHRRFYPAYNMAKEKVLMADFACNYKERVGNLSAGEIRRLQIVAALATEPELIIADEITAVLDILGRRKFLKVLQEQQREKGMTVILATNIPEGLEGYSQKILLLHHARQIEFSSISEFLSSDNNLADAVVRRLENV
jgi:ABC-2 type transport system ATP-binding protein